MSPGELWREAKNAATERSRASIAAMLGCTPGQDHAVAPFAPLNHDGRWWIAANTTPCPTLGAVEIITWEPGHEVVLIDPKTGAARLIDDEAAQFVGEPEPLADGPLHVFTNGLSFARAWAAARSDWIERLHRDIEAGIVQRGSVITEPADASIPGVLLCGDLGDVRDLSPIRQGKALVIDDARMVRRLSDALLRAANLPSVSAAPARLRAVA